MYVKAILYNYGEQIIDVLSRIFAKKSTYFYCKGYYKQTKG